MRVTIIGAGMTALLAAKACYDEGVKPVILSKDQPNPGYGVRYLHAQCGLPMKPIMVKTSFMSYFRRHKSWDDVDVNAMAQLYANKTGSSQTNNSVHRSAKYIKAYDWYEAWSLLQGFQWTQHTVTPQEIPRLSLENDLVICTAPLPRIYPEVANLCKHRITYVTEGQPYSSHRHSMPEEDNIIVYNVDPEEDWTRFSRIGGVEQTEWMHDHEGAHSAIKVDGTIDWAGHSNVILLGRYGAWDAEFMAHDAYYKTKDILGRMIERELKCKTNGK